MYMLDYVLNFIMGRSIYCPRCLKRWPLRGEIKGDVTCEKCGYVIPMTYVRECEGAPPVFVQLFGLPSSGKTTFLDMLRRLLYDMDTTWSDSGYYTRPLTQGDMDHKTVMLTDREQGILAPSTPKSTLTQSDVHILALKGMPRWKSRTLVLMDHSGEHFEKLHYELADIPFLRYTQIALLLVSLPDLDAAGKHIDDLANGYIQSLENAKVDLTRECRQLIVVFSKSDLLATRLPRQLNSYLSSDTSYESVKRRQIHTQVSDGQMDQYLQEMDGISEQLRAWVRQELYGGAAMLQMLADRGVTTHFTLISSTGQPLTPGGQTLVPSPRRVLDPFFWVLEYYKSLGSRGAVRANLGMVWETFSPTLRSIKSLLLLGVLFLCTLLGSLALTQNSPDLTRFGLALVALLLAILAIQWVKQPLSASLPIVSLPADKQLRQKKPHPLRRSVLNLTCLALFLACLAMFTTPGVQNALSQVTLRLVLETFILGAALFSCFQPTPRQATLSRVTLAIIVGTLALLQYTYASPLEFQVFHISFSDPSSYTLVSNIIIWTLLVPTVMYLLIHLLISSPRRNRWDRSALFLVALVCTALQFVYGPGELLQAFPPVSHPFLAQHVMLVNYIPVGFLPLVALLSLLFGSRFAPLDRVPLLILAVYCVGLLNMLGDAAMLPGGSTLPFGYADMHLLANSVLLVLAPNCIVAYGLLAVGLLMVIRCSPPRASKNFGPLDHISLFFVAFVCAQMQTFAWGDPVPQGFAIGLLGYFLLASKIVASCLVILVYLGCGLGLLLLLLPLLPQFKQLKHLDTFFAWLKRQPRFKYVIEEIGQTFTMLQQAIFGPDPAIVKLKRGPVWLRQLTHWWQGARTKLRHVLPALEVALRILERLLICVTALGCALLVELYGWIAPTSFWTFQFGSLPMYQVVAGLFFILAIVDLCLVKFPLQRGTRFLLLLNIILCSAFYLGQAAPQLPLSLVLSGWNEAAYSSQVPYLLFAGLCLGTALLSFWWAERALFSGDRRLLQIVFSLAMLGALLQLFTSALCFTLLALVMGMALATIVTLASAKRGVHIVPDLAR